MESTLQELILNWNIENSQPSYKIEIDYLDLVKRDPFLIEHIPTEKQTRDVQLSVVESKAFQNGEIDFKFFKNPSYDVSLKAVAVDGYNLAYILDRTDELCLIAVKSNGAVIAEIDDPSVELQWEALRTTPSSIAFFKATPEMKLEAIKADGMVLRLIESPSEKMKLEAVKQNGIVLEFIESPTYEIELEAVKSNGYALEFVSKQTPELVFEALKSQGLAFDVIYKKNLTPEIVHFGITSFLKNYDPASTLSNSPIYGSRRALENSLLSFPKEIIEKMLYNQFFQTGRCNIDIYELSPDAQKNMDGFDWDDSKEGHYFWSEVIVNKNFELFFANFPVLKYSKVSDVIQHIESPSIEMQFEAVRQNGLALEYIKSHSFELQLEAVRQNGLALQFASRSTPEIVLEAVRQNGLALEFSILQSDEIINTAILSNYKAYKFVHEKSQALIENTIFSVLRDYEPGGEISNFPKEIIGKMLEYQMVQENLPSVEVFENKRTAMQEELGFEWVHTSEGADFWDDVIQFNQFDEYFKAYPERIYENSHLNSFGIER